MKTKLLKRLRKKYVIEYRNGKCRLSKGDFRMLGWGDDIELCVILRRRMILEIGRSLYSIPKNK